MLSFPKGICVFNLRIGQDCKNDFGLPVYTNAMANSFQLQEDWLLRNKEAINADLDESFAQAARGEGYSTEDARALLALRRSKSIFHSEKNNFSA